MKKNFLIVLLLLTFGCPIAYAQSDAPKKETVEYSSEEELSSEDLEEGAGEYLADMQPEPALPLWKAYLQGVGVYVVTKCLAVKESVSYYGTKVRKTIQKNLRALFLKKRKNSKG